MGATATEGTAALWPPVQRSGNHRGDEASCERKAKSCGQSARLTLREQHLRTSCHIRSEPHAILGQNLMPYHVRTSCHTSCHTRSGPHATQGHNLMPYQIRTSCHTRSVPHVIQS